MQKLLSWITQLKNYIWPRKFTEQQKNAAWEQVKARLATTEESQIWDSLVTEQTCPVCEKKGELSHYASGGAAENWECLNCGTCYWLCPIPNIGRDMGARIITGMRG